MKAIRRYTIVIFTMIALAVPVLAQKPVSDDYEVSWNEPGKDFKDSMPAGNGDLGINLWTEDNGDIVFLIGKTDAWTENGQLVKLGRVRLHLSPSPFDKRTFIKQQLLPKKGEILIAGKSGAVLRAWVDANHPVIHVELDADQPVSLIASAELWRTQARVTKQKGLELGGVGVFRELSGIPDGEITVDPDTILPARQNQLCWLHHNARSTYPLVFEKQHLGELLTKYPDPLKNLTFGLLMQGGGLVSKNDQVLQADQPRNKFKLDVVALTRQGTVADWHRAITKIAAEEHSRNIDQSRQAHYIWWANFWNRSWINVSGDANASKVTQGYAMQRWMCAASGRGKMPLKYNGSIFTVGQEPPPGTGYQPALGQLDPDHRAWGGNYWFQNQRLIYWPMIASGDTDLLRPFIDMYASALPLARDRTRLMYGHRGAVFPETIYFWGLPNNNDFGWGNSGMIIKNTWIKNHTNGSLELISMMLDRYDACPDDAFLQDKLMPIADAVTAYYDQHWKRVDGKLDMQPAQALETRQTAINPTPDIAGLMDILPRLLSLPAKTGVSASRKVWQRLLNELPPIPTGRTDSTGKSPLLLMQMSQNGKEIILPAAVFSKPSNVENPELYTVFPFRIFGTDRPGLELARNTFDAKLFKSSTCWGQDGIQAAMLGWPEKAKAEVIANFTHYGGEKFKWFWAKGHDWEPDMDNGGAGQMALQAMLLQTHGDRILLFPAWPKSWDVSFKLHAPKNTVLEGDYREGKLINLKVIPETRRKDVVNMLQ